jgi:hypothetical protein
MASMMLSVMGAFAEFERASDLTPSDADPQAVADEVARNRDNWPISTC